MRTDSGTGGHLPHALGGASRARSEAEALSAYRRIENETLLQCELYEAVEPTLEILLSIVATCRPTTARWSVAELIQQVVFGRTRESEVEHGIDRRWEKCRELARDGLWIFNDWLCDSDDADVREYALLSIKR